MNSLVLYYSRSGNTESVARRIAQDAGADVERLLQVDETHGYMRCAIDAILKRRPDTKPIQASITDYALVFIGTPVWRMNATPPVQSFLAAQDWTGRSVALFCTMGGMGDRRTFATMRQLLRNANVVGELGLNGSDVKNSAALDAKVAAWVKTLTESTTG